jgi:hypothetical protein
MTSVEPTTNNYAAPRATAERRFRIVAGVLGSLFAIFAIATLLPTPSDALSVARNVFVLPIPFVAWWAYVRAPAPLRRPLLLFAVAAILWLGGSFVWYGYFFAADWTVPTPPGPADALFLTGRLFIVAGIVAALRSAIHFRIAALDALVIVAAGLAVGAAFVGHRLEEGFTASTLVTLNGPVLGVVILILLVSAAFGSWEGIPRSFALLGAGVAALTVGSLIYSVQAVRHAYVDDRWAGLAWSAAGVLVLLTGTVIALGLDRPLRLPSRAAIPNHPPGSNSILLLSLGALALALGVAFYGDISETQPVAAMGVLASVTIGIAMALRARAAIRTAEDAYARLDRALAAAEQSGDQLALANEELQRANVQLNAMQIALADALNLADERSHGRMRELIEDTGEELAELLEEHMGRRGPG